MRVGLSAVVGLTIGCSNAVTGTIDNVTVAMDGEEVSVEWAEIEKPDIRFGEVDANEVHAEIGVLDGREELVFIFLQTRFLMDVASSDLLGDAPIDLLTERRVSLLDFTRGPNTSPMIDFCYVNLHCKSCGVTPEMGIQSTTGTITLSIAERSRAAGSLELLFSGYLPRLTEAGQLRLGFDFEQTFE